MGKRRRRGNRKPLSIKRRDPFTYYVRDNKQARWFVNRVKRRRWVLQNPYTKQIVKVFHTREEVMEHLIPTVVWTIFEHEKQKRMNTLRTR